MTIYLSFPTNVECSDNYCPTSEYGQHSHTLYNVYGVPVSAHYSGMSELAAAEVATVIRPYETAPVNSTVKGFQNV